ncbi:MAG TPA: hypothetical protein PK014_08385 [Thermoanaerobaculia bacterium]|nr:hypothetical protein [Thermoanaerobaculia bacterium]HUM30154.1 hypothetical protein [Thermoanaerobaculia bacterium]HXK68396.1 hypothetical protein [Thermoanaerobaculia bacterium]
MRLFYLRLVLHFVMIFIFVTIITIVFSHHDIPVVKDLIEFFSYSHNIWLALTATLVLHRLWNHLLIFTLTLLLCVIHRDMLEIQQIFLSVLSGWGLGAVLLFLFQESVPQQPL